jgi:ketosteroid isomerase-like protein
MNNGQDGAGLASMAGDVVIIDDVPPFRRTGRHEAELWFQRLAVARHQVDASLTLKDAEVRVAGDQAYVVAPGLYRGMLEGSRVDVQGTLTATLRRHESTWLIDGLIWGCEI